MTRTADFCDHPGFRESPTPMWLCEADTAICLASNHAADVAFGFLPEQWKTLRLDHLQADGDHHALGAALARVARHERLGRWRLRTRRGDILVADFTAVPTTIAGGDARLVCAVDVTRVTRLETELRASEDLVAQLLSALDHASDLVLGIDARHVTAALNETARNRLRLEAGAAGCAWQDLVVEAHRAQADDAVDRSFRGQRVAPFEIALVTPSGDPLPVEVRMHPVFRAGRIAAVQALATDLTARYRIREQLLQDEKMATLGRLAGALAHDFNNLLTVILGYTDECEAALTEPEALAHVRHVRLAASRAVDLTSRLLRFSRKQEVQSQPFSLNDEVRQTAPLLERLIGRGIELRLDLEPALPPTRGVPIDIEQMLLNLAANARDAMPSGGTLRIATGVASADDVHGQDGAAWNRLTVSDTGVGMTPTARARIFEPFFTTKAPGLGTGIGLMTVAAIVDRAGGRIAVTSVPDEGTAFDILLPAIDGRSEAPMPVGVTSSAGGNESILVVEPDEPVRTFVVDVLRRRGYDVRVAARYAAAAEILDGGPVPALLFVDPGGPAADRRALVHDVRRRWPALRVLVVTGTLTEPLDPADAYLAQLSKPFTVEQLATAVRASLDAPA